MRFVYFNKIINGLNYFFFNFINLIAIIGEARLNP